MNTPLSSIPTPNDVAANATQNTENNNVSCFNKVVSKLAGTLTNFCMSDNMYDLCEILCISANIGLILGITIADRFVENIECRARTEQEHKLCRYIMKNSYDTEDLIMKTSVFSSLVTGLLSFIVHKNKND